VPGRVELAGCSGLGVAGWVLRAMYVWQRNHDASQFHGLNLIFGVPTMIGCHNVS